MKEPHYFEARYFSHLVINLWFSSFIQGKKCFHFCSILSQYHKISQNISSLKEGIWGRLNMYSRTTVVNICLRENYSFVLFELRTLFLDVQRLSIFTRRVTGLMLGPSTDPLSLDICIVFLGEYWWVLLEPEFCLGWSSNDAFCLFCILLLIFRACIFFQHT